MIARLEGGALPTTFDEKIWGYMLSSKIALYHTIAEDLMFENVLLQILDNWIDLYFLHLVMSANGSA